MCVWYLLRHSVRHVQLVLDRDVQANYRSHLLWRRFGVRWRKLYYLRTRFDLHAKHTMLDRDHFLFEWDSAMCGERQRAATGWHGLWNRKGLYWRKLSIGVLDWWVPVVWFHDRDGELSDLQSFEIHERLVE